MTRLSLDQNIQQAKDEVLILGSMVEQAMQSTVQVIEQAVVTGMSRARDTA